MRAAPSLIAGMLLALAPLPKLLDQLQHDKRQMGMER